MITVSAITEHITHHCQVCGDPEPAFVCTLEITLGESRKVAVRCCGKCREFIEAGGYSNDPDWRRFLATFTGPEAHPA